MIVNNQKVRFSFYRGGQLWYETECGFRFPVPISDAGTATFMAEDRAILFMRYIRKKIAALDEAGRSSSGFACSAGFSRRSYLADQNPIILFNSCVVMLCSRKPNSPASF